MTDTQEIVWGDPIAVDGKRPGFVRDDDRCLPHWEDEGWYDEKDGSAGDCVSGWSTVTAIRLPADHPHYRQPAPIDWSGELEAVHEDGRVMTATIIENDGGNMPWLVELKGGGRLWSFPNGDMGGGWRIRNVTPQPTPQADTKPDVTALREKIMEAARVVTEGRGNWGHDRSYRDGASAMYTVILAQLDALLPEPVDPEYERAEKLLTELWYEEDRFAAIVKFAAEQVARGRELALAGETGE